MVEPITLVDLPPPGDDAIFGFAMLFNGCGHHASFDACADAARAGRRTDPSRHSVQSERGTL